MSEYFCPNCGADLGDQPGFDPDVGTWTCTECGQTLYGDDIYDGDIYPGVMWYCDNCGALLNKQFGFSDTYSSWTCTECGHENPIAEDQIYESKEAYQQRDDNRNYSFDDDDEDDDDELDEFDEDDDESYSSGISAAAYARYEREQQQEAERRIQQERARERRRARLAFYKKHWKGILIGIVVLALGLFIAYEVYEYQKSIEVGYSSEEFIGQDIATAEKMLRRSGFTNIKKEAVKDIDISEVELEKTVKLVRIKKKTEFSKDKKFPYDTEVVVQYHVVPKIKIPISSKEAKKMKMSKLKETLEEAGFVNVKPKADYDLIKGWISKKEDVEYISIDGDKRFKEGEKYRPDAKIVIKYHAFKKDKKK